MYFPLPIFSPSTSFIIRPLRPYDGQEKLRRYNLFQLFICGRCGDSVVLVLKLEIVQIINRVMLASVNMTTKFGDEFQWFGEKNKASKQSQNSMVTCF